MDDLLFLVILIVSLAGIGIFFYWQFRHMPQQIQSQTENFYKAIQEFVGVRDALVSEVPRKVLQTIQGSINPTKGKAGELIVYMKLFSAYSRIFAFGKPIDFIGIKEDSLDFIEVKTGQARLTEEEKKLRDLILAKKINFVVVRPELSIQTSHDIPESDKEPNSI
jgi:predicted Holliday junction resolvase-like endonuclease